MSDMKCPFCGKEIIKLNEVMYGCVCDDTLDKYGTKELWQELITTRKALDYCINELDTIRQKDLRTAVTYPKKISEYCTHVIDQINEITKGGK